MKAALIACTLLVGVACGAPESTDYSIKTVFDPCEPVVLTTTDGSDSQKASIAAAAQLWNDLAGAKYTVEDVKDAPHIPIHFDDAGGNFHGFYDDTRAEIFINNDLSGEKRVITIAHEVGHTLGLIHVPPKERISVMNSGNLKELPDAGDKAQLIKLWGECPPDAPAPSAP